MIVTVAPLGDVEDCNVVLVESGLEARSKGAEDERNDDSLILAGAPPSTRFPGGSPSPLLILTPDLTTDWK